MRSIATKPGAPQIGVDQDIAQAAAEHIAEQEQLSAEAAPQAPEEEKKTFLGLKPTQVVGGALASCTAAVLGGQLGVAGTGAGASLTSVTIAVGGALYTKTFDKTRDHLDTAVSRFRLGGTTTAALPAQGYAGSGAPGDPDATRVTPIDPDATRATPVGDRLREELARAGLPAADADTDTDKPWYQRVKLAHVIATAAAFFLIAAVVVTGLEAFRGQSV
ncbi:MAG: hypothetical protein Q4F67_16625, partial [Propionibacteriaceae bacterium]|nr:hypothetical protein [Propionibacteriaceae bacterium]